MSMNKNLRSGPPSTQVERKILGAQWSANMAACVSSRFSDTHMHEHTCACICNTHTHTQFLQGLVLAVKAFTTILCVFFLSTGLLKMLINTPSPDLCLSSHTQSSCHFPSSPLLPLTSVAAASRTVCSPSSRGSAQCSGLRVLAQPQAALPALSVWSGHKALCQVGQRPIQTSRELI